jgi:signal transduction histidine kinase/ActR/RegA family two-component response regulator
MPRRASDAALFDAAVWQPALEKFGAVTNLSVAVYGADGEIACGPLPMSPLFAIFDENGFDPGAHADCVTSCLAQTTARPAVVVTAECGLAVVGTSLILDGRIVGAAVAGYALIDFCQRQAIERMARQAAVPFRQLWDIARQQQPIPSRRLVLHGELLQVLCDTLIRENARTRQYEEAAERLTVVSAAKDEFLAVLSHELRTPLTPILGWARLLKTGLAPAKVARAADVIERNTQLQLRLVDDLVELNRSMRGSVVLDLKVQDLGDMVRRAVEALADAAGEKGVIVRCIDDGEPMRVSADDDRLQQVFRNVLSNAVKFTPPGGNIVVTLSRQGDEAVAEVRDTGEGLAADFLPSAFEMFRQQEAGTRRQHAGLGIGLALVKRLMDAHGASVTIASEGYGRGAVVTMRFALVRDGRAVEAESQPMSHALDAVRILVVEDADDARDAIDEMLQHLGAVVTTARDGLDALEQLTAKPVDIVLCDLRMPRMDGFEFLVALRQRDGGTRPPVIAVSGFASSADHRRTQAAGFEDHIDKPFDERRVVAAVGAAMGRHTD